MADILDQIYLNFNEAFFWVNMTKAVPLIFSFFTIGFSYHILKNLLIGGTHLKFKI